MMIGIGNGTVKAAVDVDPERFLAEPPDISCLSTAVRASSLAIHPGYYTMEAPIPGRALAAEIQHVLDLGPKIEQLTVCFHTPDHMEQLLGMIPATLGATVRTLVLNVYVGRDQTRKRIEPTVPAKIKVSRDGGGTVNHSVAGSHSHV